MFPENDWWNWWKFCDRGWSCYRHHSGHGKKNIYQEIYIQHNLPKTYSRKLYVYSYLHSYPQLQQESFLYWYVVTLQYKQRLSISYNFPMFKYPFKTGWIFFFCDEIFLFISFHHFYMLYRMCFWFWLRNHLKWSKSDDTHNMIQSDFVEFYFTSQPASMTIK